MAGLLRLSNGMSYKLSSISTGAIHAAVAETNSLRNRHPLDAAGADWLLRLVVRVCHRYLADGIRSSSSSTVLDNREAAADAPRREDGEVP